MRRVGSFLAQPAPLRRGLLEAWATLLVTRLRLRFRPFRETAVWSARARHVRPGRLSVRQVARCVETMAPYVPSAACLAKALAARKLLARRGHRPELRIGVARERGGALEAHAWLVLEGSIVIGNLADLDRYAPLRGDLASSATPLLR